MDINIKTSGNKNTGFVRIPRRTETPPIKVEDVIKKASADSSKKNELEAKAMLAKLKVENSKTQPLKFRFSETFATSKKYQYEELEESVIKDYKKAFRSRYENALMSFSQNPINDENINYYKGVIKEFASKSPLQVLQEVEFCKNPLELFVIIKKNIKDIAIQKSDSAISNLLHRVKYEGVTSKSQNEFNLGAVLSTRSYKKLTNLLTPRSKNPEVIKLEQEAVSLGAKKVNFSDDLKNAKMVNEVLKEFNELGLPIPDKITISAFCQSGMQGCELTAPLKSKNETHVFLAHSEDIQLMNSLKSNPESILNSIYLYKNSSADVQKKLNESLKNKIEFSKSTNNPKHTIYHEFAHAFQPKQIVDYLRQLSSEEMEVAGQISSYAKTFVCGLEAMPEMFAKLMDRQPLSSEQMKLYLKLGGIVPKF